MDFMDPGLLISGTAISTCGLAIFVHGKKMERFPSLGVGLAMMTFPIFVHSVLWMWAIAITCLAALFLLPRDG